MLPLLLLTVLPACKKYEDGPYLSFTARKERLSNNWKVDKVYRDGIEYTDQYKEAYPDLVWKFSEDGTVHRTFTYAGIEAENSGTWSFQSNDEEVLVMLNNPATEQVWVILRLMEDDLRIKYSTKDEVLEFHFVPGQ